MKIIYHPRYTEVYSADPAAKPKRESKIEHFQPTGATRESSLQK